MKRMIMMFCTLLVLWSAASWADEQLKTSVEVRHRYEINDKGLEGLGYNNFGLLRTRVGLAFSASENTKAFVQVQDSRVMGSELNTLDDGSADALDFHQAYFKVLNLFDQPVSLKAGRMEVAFGGQRLMGAVGWSNIGRAFDGVMLIPHGDKFKINLFALSEVESLMVGGQGDLNVMGAYGYIKAIENHSIEPFAIWQRTEPTEHLSRWTLGARAAGKAGAISYEAEAAIQTGTVTPDSVKLDVNAYMGALNLTYVADDISGKPSFSAGIDLLSGDNDPGDTDAKVFNTLYATNHKFYGSMDYFVNIPVDTYGLGLMDSHIKLGISPHAKTSLHLAAHLFQSAEEATLADTSTSKSFGTEVDLTMKHKYSDNVNFVVGGSIFSPGDIFKDKKGDEPGLWGYIMTTISI